MSKKVLTDRALKALKRAKQGQRYEVADAVVPGLIVRVTDKGTKTFALVARFPGSHNPTRRALGEYGAMTLELARAEARKWHELLHRGVDPHAERERRRLAEARRRENSFVNVAEAYFAHIHRQGQRRAQETEQDIRTELVTRWAKRPITEITRYDLLAVIEAALERGAPCLIGQ